MAKPPEDQSFAVLTVFTSSPEHRPKFVALIHDFANAQALMRPGLCTFDLFTDEGQEHIVTLARWKDRAAFEEYKKSESGLRASEFARVLKPMVFFLRPQGTLAEAEVPVRKAG